MGVYKYEVVEGIGDEWHIYAVWSTGSKLIATRTDKAAAFQLALNCANNDLFAWEYKAHGMRAQREADLAVL